MTSNFETMAAAESAWQSARELAEHTLMEDAAERVVAGHMHFLREVIGWRPGSNALDLGAGSGHTTRAFRKLGVDMIASEHTDAGIELLKELNPGMQTQKISMADYHQPGMHSLIFARELYPITRVSAFAEQRAMLDRLIDSLAPGGVLLIVGSDAAAPDCMDYEGMLKAFRLDGRISGVFGPYLEPLIARKVLAYNRFLLSMVQTFSYPLTIWKRRRGWVATYVIAFVRR